MKFCCWIIFGSTLVFAGNRVERGPFEKVLVLNGKLVAASAEKVYAPRTSSRQVQIKWMADEGSTVEPGDSLIRFDNSGTLEKLQQISDQLDSKHQERIRKQAESATVTREKENALKTAEINYKKAMIDAEIPEGLEEAQKLQEAKLQLVRMEKGLEKARLALTNQLANNESELQKLNLEIARIDSEYKRDKRRSEAMESFAKSAGLVLYGTHPWEGRKFKVGENVFSSWMVLNIPDLRTMEVEAYVGETEAIQVKQGQPVSYRLDAYPEEAFSGKVIEVSNRGEILARWGKAPVFRVRLSLGSLDLEKMRPGMSIRSDVVVQQEEDALLYPLQLVDYRNQEFRVKPQGAEPVLLHPIGFSDFYLAVKPGEGPEGGTVLESIANGQ